MATIAENLQILKDSTDAIKLAIIDKGGDVSGDISTWAEAITGISSGESEPIYVFRGNVATNMTYVNIVGVLESKPNNNTTYFCVLAFTTSGIKMGLLSVTVTNNISIELDLDEPSNGVYNINFILIEANYKGLCNIHKVTFIQDGSFGGGAS